MLVLRTVQVKVEGMVLIQKTNTFRCILVEAKLLPNVFVLSCGPNRLFKDSFRLYVGVI